MSTSTQLPLCVYCGTERPADRSQCPKCGRPWIDVRVGSLAEAKTEALVGAAATTETPNVSAVLPLADDADITLDLSADDVGDQVEPSTPPFRRVIPVVLAASAALVVAMFAFGLLDGEPAPIEEAAPTTAVSTTAAPPTSLLVPATTAPPPTSTVPTTTIPDPAAVNAWGDPIATTRLALHQGGVGPIETGRPALEAIGQLVASLGPPESVAAAGVEDGLCADQDGRVFRWAELHAIVLGTLRDGTFVGYRYEEPAVPTSLLDLATPSGIRLGDDIATLNEVYASYSITYETAGTESTFSLFDGEELLLWGPVSSSEQNGRVEGIYSPPACPAA